MKIPGKPLSKRRFLLLSIIGYGLHITLVSLVGWPGSFSVFSDQLLPEDLHNPFMIAKNIAFCGAFLIWFLLGMLGGKRLYSLFSKKYLYCIFSALVMVGIFLIIMPDVVEFALPLKILSGALMGIGVSGNFALWQNTLCAQKTPVDAQGLIGGTILGAVLYFLLVWLQGWLISLIALIIIAPGTSLLLMSCNRRVEAASEFSDHIAERRRSLKKGILALLMPALTIGAIGFAMQTIRLLVSESSAPALLIGNSFVIALILGACLLAVFFERTGYRLKMDVYFRYGAPAIGLALLLLPFFGEGYSYIFVIASYTIFTIGSIMAILACNQVARFYSIPPIAMYSLVFGLIYTFRLLPVFFVSLLRYFGFVDFGFAETCLIALLCVGLLFGVYVASHEYRNYQRKYNIFSWEYSLPKQEDSLQTLIEAQLDRMKKHRNLTNREFEVLMFLREGRNVPFIAKKLGIAENTIRYHCKNVYSKFEVHSKQELLDCLEDEVDARH